jgi:hypothetical protein
MAYKLEFDFPNLAKGTEVQIVGLGTFRNGESYTISERRAAEWRSANTVQSHSYDEAGNLVPDDVQDPGTLYKAFKSNKSVKISKAEDPADPDMVDDEEVAETVFEEQLPLDDQVSENEGGETR